MEKPFRIKKQLFGILLAMGLSSISIAQASEIPLAAAETLEGVTHVSPASKVGSTCESYYLLGAADDYLGCAYVDLTAREPKNAHSAKQAASELTPQTVMNETDGFAYSVHAREAVNSTRCATYCR